ncbi:hypothetical protein DFP72DRAFT_1044601 [Ephemerocybe angulata]|uniref:F-box domain-containing protein n=1 Tax=Ephemerocybe angulata TaxID=980116 RepID=A0A8H6I0V3_9AGAR|nr:hypothetical protein DFP72DRAFT_1044601 [Tulosesus angulatus]
MPRCWHPQYTNSRLNQVAAMFWEPALTTSTFAQKLQQEDENMPSKARVETQRRRRAASTSIPLKNLCQTHDFSLPPLDSILNYLPAATCTPRSHHRNSWNPSITLPKGLLALKPAELRTRATTIVSGTLPAQASPPTPMTTISSLPAELLCLIFESYLAPSSSEDDDTTPDPSTHPFGFLSVSRDYTRTPIPLTHVCRAWRQTAITHRKLWSTIAFALHAPSSTSYSSSSIGGAFESWGSGKVRLLRLFLTRARGLPLSLAFAASGGGSSSSGSSSPLVREALHYMCRYAQSWAELTVDLGRVHGVQVFLEELAAVVRRGARFDALRSLQMQLADVWGIVLRRAPRLEELVLDDEFFVWAEAGDYGICPGYERVCVDDDVTEVEGGMVPWKQLKKLTVNCDSISARKIRSVCEKAPNLEELRVWRVGCDGASDVDLWMQDGSQSYDYAQHGTVTMPRLRTLVVALLAEPAQLLDAMALPALENMEVSVLALRGHFDSSARKESLAAILEPVDRVVGTAVHGAGVDVVCRVKAGCVEEGDSGVAAMGLRSLERCGARVESTISNFALLIPVLDSRASVLVLEEDFAWQTQTLIISHLSAHDIVQLQQTCKYFNNHVEGNVAVWKACLRHLCQLEGLFWPTFNGLSTAPELKSACTGMWRFKSLYRNLEEAMLYAGKSRHLPVKAYGDLAEEGDAIAYGVPAEGDSDSSDYEADEEIYGYGEGAHRKNPHPGLNSTYLIPGGRLLVTVDKTWLVLSDLGPPGETDKPAILSKHRLDSEGWLTILNVSMANDHNTLHIVIHEYLRRRLPPYVDPSRVMLGSDSRMVSALHRFELRLSADGEYTLQCLGRLCVVDEDEFEADHMVATQCAHQVALKTDSGRIILWDTLESDGTVVFWEAPESYVLSVQLGYLMTVTKDGVQAIDLSIIPRNPISNGLVELRTSSATAPPSTSQSINHPVDLENIEGVTVLPSIPARGPVRYDVEVKEGNGYGTHLRFSLDFCPDEPSPSNLIFLGKRDEGEAQIESWSKHRFETFSGYWGCICGLNGLRIGKSAGRPGTARQSHGKYTQEEESGRDEEAIRDDEDSDQGSDDTQNYDSEAPIPIMSPENQSTVIEDVHICPFSGRVVFLWEPRLVDDVMLEIVDYL